MEGESARKVAFAVGAAERASGDRGAGLKTYADADHTYRMVVQDCLAPHPVERTEHHRGIGTVPDDKGNCWGGQTKPCQFRFPFFVSSPGQG